MFGAGAGVAGVEVGGGLVVEAREVDAAIFWGCVSVEDPVWTPGSR